MKREFFISVVTALFLSLVLLCCGGGGGGGDDGEGGGGGSGNGSTSSAFVIKQLPGQLSRVDLSTGSVTVVATGLDWPSYVAITSDGKTAFVTETFGDALCKVNLSSGSITRITENLYSPEGLALSPYDETVYVLASYLSYGPTDSLYAVDVSTGIKSLITNALGSAIDIIIEPGGNYALVTWNPSGEKSKLARVDLASGIITEIANLSTSVAYGLAMEPDGNSVLVTGSPHSLKRVNLSTGNVTTFPIDVLPYPYGVVVEPNGTSALITLFGNHTLIRVNLNTYTIETIVEMMQSTLITPVGIAIMPQAVIGGVLDAPTLISPESDAVLDNNCQDRSDFIEWDFDWSDVPGATKYHIYVIGDGAINPLIDTIINSSSYHFYDDDGYITDANRFNWTWNVRAGNDSGDWSEWSEIRYFDVEPLNTDCF